VNAGDIAVVLGGLFPDEDGPQMKELGVSEVMLPAHRQVRSSEWFGQIRGNIGILNGTGAIDASGVRL